MDNNLKMENGCTSASELMTRIPVDINTVIPELEAIVAELTSASDQREINFLMGKLTGLGQRYDFNEASDEVKQLFRTTLLPLIKESYALQWILEKPFGYAGDFIVLEGIYKNCEREESSAAGRLIDRWLLDSQLASSVRERKDMLSALIEREIKSHNSSKESPFRILSLASGSARELREIPVETLNQAAITLVDQDDRALTFAASHLPPQIKTWSTNIFKLDLNDLQEDYDIIYSFGFFDYLPDRAILKCLEMCKSALKPGGSIVFPLKMEGKYRYWFYDVALDWRFVKRTYDDGLNLIRRSGLRPVEILSSSNESITFFQCKV